MRLKRSLAYIGTLGALFLSVGVAESVPVITFDDTGVQTGVISYLGGNTPAFTSAPIDISLVSGAATPFNSGSSLACFGCVLEFMTGSSASNPPGSIEYRWSGGGFFTITGSIPFLGIAPGSTLLSGTFSEAFFDRQGQQWFFTGTGPDEKHPLIVDYFFGVDSLPFAFGNTEIAATQDVVIGGNGSPNQLNSFVAPVSEADVDNIQTAIPEPGSALLLLLGLGSLAAYRRRS